ncbi:UNVERIFIED_CONTAM: hypothetical protein HDU68_000189 [Siphonaria sp. JEL0065]|nr:hypothetical protein HDU68_000189 [Siphonaria sp. JEL0065]
MPLLNNRKPSPKNLSSEETDHCGAVQPVLPWTTFFEVFQLDPTSVNGIKGGSAFTLDSGDLKSKFLRLQQLVHPDANSQRSEKERDFSERQSVFMNKAYQTLRDPLARAKYILHLNKIHVDETESKSAMSPGDLMKIMDVWEAIEEVSTQAELDVLMKENEDRIAKEVVTLSLLFPNGELEKAKEAAVRLQYCVDFVSLEYLFFLLDLDTTFRFDFAFGNILLNPDLAEILALEDCAFLVKTRLGESVLGLKKQLEQFGDLRVFEEAQDVQDAVLVEFFTSSVCKKARSCFQTLSISVPADSSQSSPVALSEFDSTLFVLPTASNTSNKLWIGGTDLSFLDDEDDYVVPTFTASKIKTVTPSSTNCCSPNPSLYYEFQPLNSSISTSTLSSLFPSPMLTAYPCSPMSTSTFSPFSAHASSYNGDSSASTWFSSSSSVSSAFTRVQMYEDDESQQEFQPFKPSESFFVTSSSETTSVNGYNHREETKTGVSESNGFHPFPKPKERKAPLRLQIDAAMNRVGGSVVCDKMDSPTTCSSSVSTCSSIGSAGLCDSEAFSMHDIVIGKDTRTAVMLKNVPNRYTQDMLLDFINETHRGTFDFFYLRMDFVNNCNVGYAFINFIDPMSIVSFSARITGQKWPKFKSSKVPILVPAKIKSKQQFIDQFRNSPVMLEPVAFRPRLFYSDGENVGLPMEFPKPGGSGGAGAGCVRAKSDVLYSRVGAAGISLKVLGMSE